MKQIIKSLYRKIIAIIKIIKFEYRMKKMGSKEKRFFLLATPNHGNIGDQAIAIAECQFFKKEFPNTNVVEISFNDYPVLKGSVLKFISSRDVVCYHGGGNMGTQYFECEQVFRDIIGSFPENKIVSFPQTIYYEQEEASQKEFEKSKKIYNAHKNLWLFAREKKSYELMKEAYANCHVGLVPDIVLYMDRSDSYNRCGATTFFRSDVEKSLEEGQTDNIYKILNELFEEVRISDTACEMYNVNSKKRITMFIHKLNEFKNSEIVITDRLHGMVFAYLTNTPCIVFSNYNHKVQGVYDWVKSTKKIVFIDEIGDMKKTILDLLAIEEPIEPIDKSLYQDLVKALH